MDARVASVAPRRCPGCGVGVHGSWEHCPICHAELPVPLVGDFSPYPDVPLRASNRLLVSLLMIVSLVVIAGSLLAQVFFGGRIEGLRLVWFTLAALWLVILTVARQRRNVAKSIASVVVLVSLACVYADYLAGWSAWSLTWVVPLMCLGSLAVMLVAVRFTGLEVGDYIIYSWVIVLLAVLPGLFIALNWVTNPLPSWISVAGSFGMLVFIQIWRGAEVQHELRKRMDL